MESVEETRLTCRNSHSADKTDCVPLSQHVRIRTDFLNAEPEMGTCVKVVYCGSAFRRGNAMGWRGRKAKANS